MSLERLPILCETLAEAADSSQKLVALPDGRTWRMAVWVNEVRMTLLYLADVRADQAYLLTSFGQMPPSDECRAWRRLLEVNREFLGDAGTAFSRHAGSGEPVLQRVVSFDNAGTCELRALLAETADWVRGWRDQGQGWMPPRRVACVTAGPATGFEALYNDVCREAFRHEARVRRENANAFSIGLAQAHAKVLNLPGIDSRNAWVLIDLGLPPPGSRLSAALGMLQANFAMMTHPFAASFSLCSRSGRAALQFAYPEPFGCAQDLLGRIAAVSSESPHAMVDSSRVRGTHAVYPAPTLAEVLQCR